MTPRLT